jgi:trans-aconitate methyltransferase
VNDPLAHDQDRHWSRHAAHYDQVFLDALDPNVENPMMAALDAVPDPVSKTVADLGCGTGPLWPYLAGRFQSVIAIDFAPAMIQKARTRLRREGGDQA